VEVAAPAVVAPAAAIRMEDPSMGEEDDMQEGEKE
jgi:hypothetical protein